MNEDLQFVSVDYPDANRLVTAFRIFTVIPIAIVLGARGSAAATGSGDAQTVAIGGTGRCLPPC